MSAEMGYLFLNFRCYVVAWFLVDCEVGGSWFCGCLGVAGAACCDTLRSYKIGCVVNTFSCARLRGGGVFPLACVA